MTKITKKATTTAAFETKGEFILSYVGKGRNTISIPEKKEGYALHKIAIGFLDFLEETVKRVEIPSTIIGIGNDAFSRCSTLEEIRVSEDNPVFSSVDGILYNKEKTKLVFCPRNKKGEIDIPSTVKTIGYGAFMGCRSYERLTIPDSVTSIGEWAFMDSSFSEIIMPDSVTTIGQHAFSGCRNLKSITIPEGVTHIQDGTFIGCVWLENILIKDKNTTAEKGAFEGCYDTPVKCPLNGGVYRHLMWGENGKDCGETQYWAVYPY